MKMCRKGFHDLDRPGNLVKRGKDRHGRQKFSCGPCVAGRTTEWDTFYRSTHDRLVCEWGHLYTAENVHWRRTSSGGWGRVCLPCKRERDAGHQRVKATQERIAELHAEGLKLGIDRLGPPGDDHDGTRPELPGDWVNQARCANRDPAMFYPDYETAGTTKAAKAVCANCPVRQECLEYALRVGEQFGVWGGMSTAERDQLAEQRRLALAS